MSDNQDKIRLNKFVGQSGLCTRREAANRIKGGLIKVNGEIVKDPSLQINLSDEVSFGKKILKIKDNYIYVLINKPKKTICTTDSIENKKTLANVLGGKIKETIFPIEPISPDDTGLVLLTNDPELVQKLSKTLPKSEVVFHVTLDRPLSEDDKNALLNNKENNALTVSDIIQMQKMSEENIQVDVSNNQYEALREAFNTLNYKVLRMDRLYYLGLNKKDLSRDRFRYLTTKEEILIKHFK